MKKPLRPDCEKTETSIISNADLTRWLNGGPECSGGFYATDALGLRFDTADDALNFAAECVERCNRWFAGERRPI